MKRRVEKEERSTGRKEGRKVGKSASKMEDSGDNNIIGRSGGLV